MSKSLKNVKFVVGVASTALLELACKNFKVLVLPSEEFDYKEFISKKKIFGLNLLNNNTVKSSKVFAKPNYELLKNLSFK